MDAAEEDIETRGKYKIPADAAEASWAELQKYMDATQVQTIFQESLRVLLQRPELPYNPYIGFHNRIKVHQEKFHLSQQTREEIVRNLNNDVENHHIETVHTVKHYSSLWGAKSIITVINPAALEKYRWLVTTVTPGLLADMDQYKTEVMVALTGPAVFTGAFYTDVPSVTIHVEYLVTGPELQQAMYQFVSSLMADIDAMYQSEHHSVLSAEIRHAENEGNKPSKVTWTLQRIGQETEEFMAQVKETVLLYKYVTLKCSFQLDPDDTRYVHGDKIYAFNFMKNADDSLAPQGIECYAEIPAVCVHTGVFFEKSGAENYFSMYEPESINMDLARLPQTDESAKGNQNPSQTSPEPGTSSSHHDNSIKMKIDGFLIPPSDDSVIFSWRITSPIRSYFQQQVAAAFTEVALYKVLYNLIILTLLDRNSLKHSEDVLVEVWRIFHGTYGHLNVLMQRNKALRAAIEAVTLDQDYGDIRPLLIQYMEDIEITLCDSFTERSQDQVNIGRVMVARVQSLLPLAENILASDSHSNFVMEDLHALNLYLVPLMMGTADICLQASDKATMFIREIKETLQQADPEVVQRIKKRPVEKPVKKRRGLFGTTEVPKKPVVTEEQEDEGEYSHGREDSVVCNHRTSVLPVQTLIDKEMSPVKVVYETVLMKYMLDCHFDDMWTGYLLELTCDVSLPRNPFSRLVSSLRQAAMRMDLCYEKPTAVVQKAFNSEQKIKHKNSYMHSIAGLGVFGLETALTLIDTGVITSILQVLQLMQQEVYIQKKGPYRVGICLALCGPCTWYGRVQPYLNKIELQEHYYIQGPSGCHGEAIQLFAELVFNNMEALQSKRKGIGLAVGGVFLGDPLTIHWTLQDMMDKKQEFLSSLAQTCRRKQPIYGKGWQARNLL
ncbi:uncharacterized protein LOC127846992 isoform X4 [Dreissena polymorpha]|uniref:uncharacterized protein LOC127846992 isoform X2 n=1 Tax=Dreissena polymorpha TaxID=45954 RepID=UPI0022652E65|nr:uncharacterized protein LOC127846992 isoform X2 [Dreissena polymorpha]XP_052234446.1 uncharacterized protein LOC127846992 isoform X3 [Dreissena polymorpha]XP_052234454.1 uncharacterized protein LOC127846992 isoform X4 [Dreissena polymorpha]